MKRLLIAALSLSLAARAHAQEVPPWASIDEIRDWRRVNKACGRKPTNSIVRWRVSARSPPTRRRPPICRASWTGSIPRSGTACLRVRLLNAQQIKAFALPNGSIYVNAGLVARLGNEAQLATVLAHEGAHFTHRHSLQQAERVRNAAAFALVVGMLGVPLVGDIVALSSMFGYSREHERKADEIGFSA